MAYSLDDFCGDVRAILSERDDHDGRQEVRRKLEVLLADPGFRAAYLDSDEDGMAQIYEDPDLRFCVLTYNMTAAHSSPPHDHGESWAVYGQALGHTDMTIWSQPDGKRIAPTRTFRLEAGQAGLFDVREIHSIIYCHGAKFVRVTGVALGRRRSRCRANARYRTRLWGARKEVTSRGASSTPRPGRCIEVASVGTSRK